MALDLAILTRPGIITLAVATKPIPDVEVTTPAPAAPGLAETDRLAALQTYGILDTDPEPGFDDLALLAARVCQAPMALIGFFDGDRYWVKAHLGLKLDAMPRQFALYAASDKPEFQEIPATLAGSRLAEHPMVSLWPNISSYPGVPIVSNSCHLLSVLAVMDLLPRPLQAQDC